MELYPKHKNDDEYIEAVRRQAARSRIFAIFHVFGVIFFLVAFLVLSYLIHSVDSMMQGVSSGVHTSVSSGVHIGIMFGFMGGVLILLAVQNVIWATQYFKGNRTELLMLKFHDELKERNRNFQPPPAGDS